MIQVLPLAKLSDLQEMPRTEPRNPTPFRVVVGDYHCAVKDANDRTLFIMRGSDRGLAERIVELVNEDAKRRGVRS